MDDRPSVGQPVLARVIYGEHHPWGFPAEGTVKSIKSLARKDLVAWHKARIQPADSALVVGASAGSPTPTSAGSAGVKRALCLASSSLRARELTNFAVRLAG